MPDNELQDIIDSIDNLDDQRLHHLLESIRNIQVLDSQMVAETGLTVLSYAIDTEIAYASTFDWESPPVTVSQVVLRFHPDLTVHNTDGTTAIEYADKYDHPNVLRLLNSESE